MSELTEALRSGVDHPNRGELMEEAADHIERLETERDALDKTKDGVPVFSGMILYEICDDYSGDLPEIREVDGVRIDTFPGCCSIEESFSTFRAAEQARGDEQPIQKNYP